MFIGFSQKIIPVEISKFFLLTAIEGLHSTVCNSTTSGLLTKFVKGVLEISENLQEVLYNGVPL